MTTDKAAAFASRIDGCEYGDELTQAERKDAAALGLLVVFGASDDLVEFRGVIDDELGARGDEVFPIARQRDGRLWVAVEPPANADELIAHGWTAPPVAFSVRVEWCPEGFDGSWRITADVPFAPFDVLEDGELYCRGAVVDAALALVEGGKP